MQFPSSAGSLSNRRGTNRQTVVTDEPPSRRTGVVLRRSLQILNHIGPAWVAFRLFYALRLRTGWLRAELPALPWSHQPLSSLLSRPGLADGELYLQYRRRDAPPFLFSPDANATYRGHFADWDDGSRSPQHVAAELAAGTVRYFGHCAGQIGHPPDWHTNPFTGRRAPADRHWTCIGDFDFDDIKIYWEPSRFAGVFALVRAYWRSGDESLAEFFWELVESWKACNPPQLGVHWKCGQEVSLRAMAWCFGLYGFLHSESTTPARVASLAQMLAVFGRRIEANFRYAASQKNNHGISEAAGLWTLGTLFPEFRRAESWKAIGRRWLEKQVRELIYEDGAFSQHSLNYHRMMLHLCLWVLSLARRNDQPFSDDMQQRVRRAVELLYQLQDDETGQVPCYGQNDGALVLPLNNCDPRDFRPVVQAGCYYLDGERRIAPGPWDEDLLWLFGPESLASPVRPRDRDDLDATAGGYYTLRSRRGFAFTRCGSFRHRPGQADMLHVDLWWRGKNVAVDAGTYSYNSPPAWNNVLAHTAFHNTVSVDGADQMDRCGRFLWLPWIRGTVGYRTTSHGGRLSYWEGACRVAGSAASPVNQRRGILRLGAEHWCVIDRLDGIKQHRYRLHWLLRDFKYVWSNRELRVTLQTDLGPFSVHLASTVPVIADLVRADPHSARGWRADHYFRREPALSVSMVAEAESVWFYTAFGPNVDGLLLHANSAEVRMAECKATIAMPATADDSRPLITCVRFDGHNAESLEVC